jgi:GntR family transcriptional regulator
MRTYEGQGLIRRRQGVGTFVVGHTQVIESGLEILESIETMASKIHLNVSMGDLLVSAIQADEAEVSEMGVEPGTELVQVARVIQAEHRPVAYLVDILPVDVLPPDELQAGFTGSVLDLLLKHDTLALATSRTEIRAVAAPADIARALEIQRGDVLLQFIAYLYTTTGRVIDYSYSYFLPGYFRFHVVRSIGAFPSLAYRAVEVGPKSTGE